MKWLQITVATTTEGSDLIASVMYDCGSEGVSISDHNDVMQLIKNKQNWDYVDEKLLLMDDRRVLVNGFFDIDFDLRNLLDELKFLEKHSEFPMGSMELTKKIIQSEDWENEWRKYYAPIKIKKVVIVPAWQKYQKQSDEVVVYIEPGMAFGTGNHETTSMCVDLMQDIEMHEKKVVDVGCGSGILGICATALDAKKCVFNDVDMQAISATKSNLALNGYENQNIVAGDLSLCNGLDQFDVVIANLTADLLIRLNDMLTSITAPKGKVIVSGIINARADEVFKKFSVDFTPVKILKQGEWQAMLFERK